MESRFQRGCSADFFVSNLRQSKTSPDYSRLLSITISSSCVSADREPRFCSGRIDPKKAGQDDRVPNRLHCRGAAYPTRSRQKKFQQPFAQMASSAPLKVYEHSAKVWACMSDENAKNDDHNMCPLAAIELALGRLDPPDRQLIELNLEGMRTREISQHLTMPISRARLALTQARWRLLSVQRCCLRLGGLPEQVEIPAHPNDLARAVEVLFLSECVTDSEEENEFAHWADLCLELPPDMMTMLFDELRLTSELMLLRAVREARNQPLS
jgi:hypothetical protein